MTTFTKLTLIDDRAAVHNKPIWVNLALVVTIFEEPSGTALWYNEGRNVIVKETPEEIPNAEKREM